MNVKFTYMDKNKLFIYSQLAKRFYLFAPNFSIDFYNAANSCKTFDYRGNKRFNPDIIELQMFLLFCQCYFKI